VNSFLPFRASCAPPVPPPSGSKRNSPGTEVRTRDTSPSRKAPCDHSFFSPTIVHFFFFFVGRERGNSRRSFFFPFRWGQSSYVHSSWPSSIGALLLLGRDVGHPFSSFLVELQDDSYFPNGQATPFSTSFLLFRESILPFSPPLFSEKARSPR